MRAAERKRKSRFDARRHRADASDRRRGDKSAADKNQDFRFAVLEVRPLMAGNVSWDLIRWAEIFPG
jgi:hypothetical protein